MSDILESIKAAYEEGFDDGMQMHRSDFDECWNASNAKRIYDSMKAARESEGGEAVEIVDGSGVLQWMPPFNRPDPGTRIYTHPPKQQSGVPKKVAEVLHAALNVAYDRKGDVDTEDGTYATTDMDSMIRLEQALCEAFDAKSDDVLVRELKPKIDALLLAPQPDKWIPCSERLPTEDDGFIWVYSTHTKAVLWRPQTWRDINMWTEREKCLWTPANLRKPTPPEQESE